MSWQVILALILAIPVLLIPVTLIWYINAGIFAAIKEARARKTAAKDTTERLVVQSDKR